MLAPVRAAGLYESAKTVDRHLDDGGERAVKTMHRRAQRSQASTQTPSRRARPSTSSRRRLTAATRSDHHRSLRWIPW
jgi:hypothetical protein